MCVNAAHLLFHFNKTISAETSDHIKGIRICLLAHVCVCVSAAVSSDYIYKPPLCPVLVFYCISCTVPQIFSSWTSAGPSAASLLVIISTFGFTEASGGPFLCGSSLTFPFFFFLAFSSLAVPADCFHQVWINASSDRTQSKKNSTDPQ